MNNWQLIITHRRSEATNWKSNSENHLFAVMLCCAHQTRPVHLNAKRKSSPNDEQLKIGRLLLSCIATISCMSYGLRTVYCVTIKYEIKVSITLLSLKSIYLVEFIVSNSISYLFSFMRCANKLTHTHTHHVHASMVFAHIGHDTTNNKNPSNFGSHFPFFRFRACPLHFQSSSNTCVYTHNGVRSSHFSVAIISHVIRLIRCIRKWIGFILRFDVMHVHMSLSPTQK